MKRILEVGIYKSGDLTYEVTNIDNVNSDANGDSVAFAGHATIKSRFKGQDFSSFYRLSKFI